MLRHTYKFSQEIGNRKQPFVKHIDSFPFVPFWLIVWDVLGKVNINICKHGTQEAASLYWDQPTNTWPFETMIHLPAHCAMWSRFVKFGGQCSEWMQLMLGFVLATVIMVSAIWTFVCALLDYLVMALIFRVLGAVSDLLLNNQCVLLGVPEPYDKEILVHGLDGFRKFKPSMARCMYGTHSEDEAQRCAGSGTIFFLHIHGRVRYERKEPMAIGFQPESVIGVPKYIRSWNQRFHLKTCDFLVQKKLLLSLMILMRSLDIYSQSRWGADQGAKQGARTFQSSDRLKPSPERMKAVCQKAADVGTAVGTAVGLAGGGLAFASAVLLLSDDPFLDWCCHLVAAPLAVAAALPLSFVSSCAVYLHMAEQRETSPWLWFLMTSFARHRLCHVI